MSSGYELTPWVEYIPDIVQDDPTPQTRRARRYILPPDGGAIVVQGEYDDGNGMWIVTGVSQ